MPCCSQARRVQSAPSKRRMVCSMPTSPVSRSRRTPSAWVLRSRRTRPDLSAGRSASGVPYSRRNAGKSWRVKSPAGFESSPHHISAVSAMCRTISATEGAPAAGRNPIRPAGTQRSSAMTPRRASAQASSASSRREAADIPEPGPIVAGGRGPAPDGGSDTSGRNPSAARSRRRTGTRARRRRRPRRRGPAGSDGKSKRELSPPPLGRRLSGVAVRPARPRPRAAEARNDLD